jgi:hypothetical protein
MARVPVYRPFQVQQQVVGQPEAQVPNVQGPGQIAGEQMQQLGQALGQAGAQVGEFALRQQQRLNRLRVTEKTNTLIGEMDRLRNEMNGFVGGDVLEFQQNGQDFTQHYRQQFQTKAAELGEGLFGADAQAEFNENIARMALNWDREVMRYHTDAVREWTETTAQDATITAGVQMANSADDPDAVLRALERFGDTRLTYYQETRGESGNYDDLIQADKEGILTGVLNNLFEREDSTTFNIFFATVKDQLTEETAATFQEAADGKAALDQAVAVVDEVLGLIKYDGFNAEEIDAEFRTRFADSPKELEAARDEFKARKQALDAQVGQVITQRFDRLLGIVRRVGLGAAQTHPEYRLLTEAEKADLETASSALTEARDLNADREQDRLLQNDYLRGNEYTGGMSLRQFLRTEAATDEVLTAMARLYGSAHVARLMDERDEYRADLATARQEQTDADREFDVPESLDLLQTRALNDYQIDLWLELPKPEKESDEEKEARLRSDFNRQRMADQVQEAYQRDYRAAQRNLRGWIEQANAELAASGSEDRFNENSRYFTDDMHAYMIDRVLQPATMRLSTGEVVPVRIEFTPDGKNYVRSFPRLAIGANQVADYGFGIPTEAVDNEENHRRYREWKAAQMGGATTGGSFPIYEAGGWFSGKRTDPYGEKGKIPTADYLDWLEMFILFPEAAGGTN